MVEQIKQVGRRLDDKKNIASQVASEQEKVATLRWEPVTLEMVKADTKSTELSNDRVMHLGEEILHMHIWLTENSVQEFWKKLPIPEEDKKPW